MNKDIAFYNAVYKVPHNFGIDHFLRSTELPVSTCSPGLSTAIHIPQGNTTLIYTVGHIHVRTMWFSMCIAYSMYTHTSIHTHILAYTMKTMQM